MPSLQTILDDRKLYSVQKTDTILEVVRKMSALRVGAILVLDGEALCGIFSERDLMTRVVLEGLDIEKTPVERVMSTSLYTISDTASVEEAMEQMRRHQCRHLPVLRGERVAGMVSMRDLMNYELQRKTEEIQYMRNYIHGAS